MNRPRRKDNLTKQQQEENKRCAEQIKRIGKKMLKELEKEQNEHVSNRRQTNEAEIEIRYNRDGTIEIDTRNF